MLLLTGFISFGDDFASSTLDVMGNMLVSFNTPIILIVGVLLVAVVIGMIIKAIKN